DCLKTVAAGDSYLTPSMSACLLKRRTRRDALEMSKPCINALTTGERRILRRVADNRSSKEIGREFSISHRTVEAHRANICSKLELHRSLRYVQFSSEQSVDIAK